MKCRTLRVLETHFLLSNHASFLSVFFLVLSVKRAKRVHINPSNFKIGP